jgi:polyisoprenoid-binding protein YceI
VTGLRSLNRTRVDSFGDLPTVPAGRWTVDPERSTVAFTIRHLSVATVRGAFGRFDGWLETDDSGLTAAAGTAETASISTGDAKRDAALLKAGFLDADRYPSISLASSEIALHEGRVCVLADLTMKGVTRPIRLTVTAGGLESESGPVSRARIVAAGTISRSEFGVTGGGVLESHGALVSDTVKIALEVSATRQLEGGR